MVLEIKLFGTPEFRSRGTPIVLPSARAQNLLAYLALRHGTPQRRDHLAFLLWPDSTEKQARTNLRHVVHTLRASIPDADHYLRATPQTLAWDGSWVDVSVFEQTLASSDGDVADVAALRAATDLYAGDLLQGWYDDWVEPERERLRRRALVAHEQLVSLLTDSGEFDDAIDYAERARTLDPLAETTYRSLMRLYDARGDRARALRVYHEGVATLEENLGVEPSAETRAIYESLLPTTEAAPTSTAASPLVGRQPERRRLTELWREARAGKAQLVLLTGEPGIGKTRLAEELRRWAAHRGAATASARSYAVEGTLPYAPVVAWLREPAIARRRARLDAAQLAQLARLLPEVSAEPAPADPESRVRLFDATVRALLAGPEPVLLVADDLAAADAQTLQFLHYLLRVEPRASLLVVATARLAEIDADNPLLELLTRLRAGDRSTRLELPRFDAGETAVLAERITRRALPADEVAWLHDQTAGNPLFVVETLRAGWPGAGRPETLTPKTHAVLAARLLQLSATARELLGVAATVGASIPADVLARVRPGAEDTVGRDLDELWRRQLLLATGVGTYDFSHDKLREVAYTALSPALRQRNHGLIAGALQDAYPDRLDEVAGQVGAHLDAASARSQATEWYVRAAAAARRVHADADAAHLLDRALETVRAASDSAHRQQRELELLAALPGPLAAAEGYASPRLATALAAGFELAQRLGAPLAAPLLRAQAMAVLSRGDFDAALDIGGQLRARGDAEADDVLVVEGAFVQGVAAYWRGELTVAGEHLEAAVARYRPANRGAHLSLFAQDPQVLSVARLAHISFFEKDHDDARRLQGVSLDLAREVGHPFTLGVALLFGALLDVEMADVGALRAHFAELDDLRNRLDFPAIGLMSEALQGLVDVIDGRGAPGFDRIDATLTDPRARTAPGLPAILLRIRLAACEYGADPQRAVDTAERLLRADVRVWDATARQVLHATTPRNAGGTHR